MEGDGDGRLLRLEEAAEIARVQRSTVHWWSCDGRLDRLKVGCGRRTLLVRDEFIRWLLDDPAVASK